MCSPAPQPTSYYFMAQRTRLHYLDWGNPGAPLLILQHGVRDHAHSWDWVARDLCRDWHRIAPDLRGHGDSGWSPDGAYAMPFFIYDLAQLIDHLSADNISVIAHSMGGNIATRYAGLFPEKIRRLVNIEGFGPPPELLEKIAAQAPDRRWRLWLERRHGIAGRPPKRYASVDEAVARMCAENSNLSAEQARHLTFHGIAPNDDGTFSWKFDDFVRSHVPMACLAAGIAVFVGQNFLSSVVVTRR